MKHVKPENMVGVARLSGLFKDEMPHFAKGTILLSWTSDDSVRLDRSSKD
jgi:hypothetical protein